MRGGRLLFNHSIKTTDTSSHHEFNAPFTFLGTLSMGVEGSGRIKFRKGILSEDQSRHNANKLRTGSMGGVLFLQGPKSVW